MVVTLKEIGHCSLCKKERIIIGHHLSYVPEVVIKVCYTCHLVMHYLQRYPATRIKIIELIDTYGHNWIKGSYAKSNRCTSYRKEWKQSENGKESRHRYNQSENGKKSHAKYDQSEKGRARYIKYGRSDKGIARRLRLQTKSEAIA